MNFNSGGITVSKMSLTNKPNANREAVYQETEKSTERSTKKLTSQGLQTSQKPTGIQSTETHREVDPEVYQEVH